MEQVQQFFQGNPHYFGIVFFLFGVVLLISSIKDANWLLGDVSSATYSLKKIDGWVNIFGRKTARILAIILSFVIMLLGITWFLLYTYYKR